MSDSIENIAKDILQSETVRKSIRNAVSGVFFKDKKSQKNVEYGKFQVFIPGNSPETATGTRQTLKLPVDNQGKPITSSLPMDAIVIPPRDPNSPIEPVVQYRSFFEDTVRLNHKLPEVFEQCQKVYNAVGRIGVRQIGEPTGTETAFGTGILMSSRHILTNHHVYYGMLSNTNNEIGIEFGAEKGTEFSDFVKISDTPAIKINNYDAVLLTLAEPISHREPVKMTKEKVNTLENRNIIVIGYPMTRSDTRPNLVLATKRYARGKIFRHSTDQSKYVTVTVGAHPIVGEDVYMEAICHNASTLPGNSGSAVVDQDTGELIALHFGGDAYYRNGESANFAIPGEKIAKKIKKAIKKNS